MASLCHPWFTTTNLSYRFPIFETSATALCGTTGIKELYIIHIQWLMSANGIAHKSLSRIMLVHGAFIAALRWSAHTATGCRESWISASGLPNEKANSSAPLKREEMSSLKGFRGDLQRSIACQPCSTWALNRLTLGTDLAIQENVCTC